MSEFPMDVGQTAAGCRLDGVTSSFQWAWKPRHAWRYRATDGLRWIWPHENRRPLWWPARPDAYPDSVVLTATSSPFGNG